MRPIALVRANALIPFVTFLEGIGAPAERSLREVGLSTDIVSRGEHLLPLRQCLAFIAQAARSEHLPELGLIVGGQTRFEQMGLYARLIRHCATVKEALEMLAQAIVLHSSGDVVWLTINGDRAAFCHRFTEPGSPGWLQGECFTLHVMLSAVHATIGPGWKPDEIRLPAGATALRTLCEDLVHTPVVCTGDATAVVFPRSLLNAPNRAYRSSENNGREFDYLRATAPAPDFARSVQQTIGALLIDGYPHIRRTAQGIGLSVRTLQRRLTEAGVSYSHLVDAARCDASMLLMQEHGAKLIEIAGDLGYADPANFTRAFRRWTGMPPRAFRRSASRASSE